MEYKLNTWRNIWCIFEIILFLGISLFFLIGPYIFEHSSTMNVFIPFLILFLVINLPHIIIYVNYLSKSKGQIVYIDYDLRKIEFTKNNITKHYKFDEIKEVLIIMASYTKFPWNSYGYAIIGLKDENAIIITSLMTDMEEFKIEKTSKFTKRYPYI